MQFRDGMKIGDMKSQGAGAVTRPQLKDPFGVVTQVAETLPREDGPPRPSQPPGHTPVG